VCLTGGGDEGEDGDKYLHAAAVHVHLAREELPFHLRSGEEKTSFVKGVTARSPPPIIGRKRRTRLQPGLGAPKERHFSSACGHPKQRQIEARQVQNSSLLFRRNDTFSALRATFISYWARPAVLGTLRARELARVNEADLNLRATANELFSLSLDFSRGEKVSRDDLADVFFLYGREAKRSMRRAEYVMQAREIMQMTPPLALHFRVRR